MYFIVSHTNSVANNRSEFFIANSRWVRRLALIVILSLSPMSPAVAQNLVIDGGFASGLTSWRLTGEGSAATSIDDINNDPSSGSVLLRNAEIVANTRTHPIDQCITINLPGEYVIGASSRIEASQAPGRATLSYQLYTGSNCDGGIGSGGGRFIPPAPTWTAIEFFFRIDIVPVTLLVRIGVDKPDAEGSLEFQADQVYLEPVFRSGFE